jgi:hypothetical protein
MRFTTLEGSASLDVKEAFLMDSLSWKLHVSERLSINSASNYFMTKEFKAFKITQLKKLGTS